MNRHEMIYFASIDRSANSTTDTATCRVTMETIESILGFWQDSSRTLCWDCLFVTPVWLRLWWTVFQSGPIPRFPAVWREGELLGFAPLVIKGETATFIGSPDVCDYLDMVVQPGSPDLFVEVLLEHLVEQGVRRLDLQPVRRDSKIVASLGRFLRLKGWAYTCIDEDVSLEMKLPGTWDAFLHGLSAKDRHEIRRKLRRLHKAGNIRLRVVDKPDAVGREMEAFLRLFHMSRRDKSLFMTETMASFFRKLAVEMAALNIMKLMFLDVNEDTAASVMCFDYGESLYLYNNGYDPRYLPLSPGLMSKVMSIRYAVENGKSEYSFLKGSETYKYRLGGKPIAICRCEARLG